jgi:dihydrodipicolinate synthase/N-acetylneuraminate lyase
VPDTPPIALPAPTFRHADGELDQVANARYAEHVAGTWITNIVVAGPMGAGENCTADQRAAVVDLWARHHPPEHLIVACWERHELDRTLRRGMRALVMLHCDTDRDLFRDLVDLPAEAIAYTNPRYSRAVLTADVIRQARNHGGMPSGAKFSKVPLAELAEVRAAGGASLHMIHGSSRNIAGSLATGVNLVVSSPLAALPQPWPAPTLDAIQHAADRLQPVLDAQCEHAGRITVIATLARQVLGGFHRGDTARWQRNS